MTQKKKMSIKQALIIGSIMLLLAAIYLLILIHNDNNPKMNNAEITSLDNKLIYSITNRDSFTWTNVSIIVNDYYNCGEFGDVAPEEEIQLIASSCGDFITKYSYVSKIKLISDQGNLEFGR
jgi:hypothetical protein